MRRSLVGRAFSYVDAMFETEIPNKNLGTYRNAQGAKATLKVPGRTRRSKEVVDVCHICGRLAFTDLGS